MVDIFRGYGVEVKIGKPADFLVIKETLTRIGVAEDTTLFQSCHILHKQGRYAIIHEQELHAMDGHDVKVTPEDIERRNKIVGLLAEWDLVKVLAPDLIEQQCPLNQIKILSFKEKAGWKLVPKYRFMEKRPKT